MINIDSKPPPERRDGPWLMEPPLQIDYESSEDDSEDETHVSYGMKDYYEQFGPLWSFHQLIPERSKKIPDLLDKTPMAPALDMVRMVETGSDEEIAEEVERHYVNAQWYLDPRWSNIPSSLLDRWGDDWGWNARGVYYRHYLSYEWVTKDHNLWVPVTRGVDWDNPAESQRRASARLMVQHNVQNENGRKSEFVWKADAWADVFGKMRNDPVIVADRHEYNTILEDVDTVSCLLAGESKFIKRIPDVTFGLATFQPEDYQKPTASYELDRDRLQALSLHRDCALVTDPRWGYSNLVFPFATYEGRGWEGDPHDARQRACSAAMAYLDMLDNLARTPRKPGQKPGIHGQGPGHYQIPASRSTQVFVLTSYGAHWHILVGYRRPRLIREHSRRQGLSQNVYLFQRIWSGRVITERSAWELLYMVDQIHKWGATTFRDYVIRHLKPWHRYAVKCFSPDIAELVLESPKTQNETEWPKLPEWTQWISQEFRAKLALRFRDLCRENRQTTDKKMHRCTLDDCATCDNGLGLPVLGAARFVEHVIDVHSVELHDPVSQMARVVQQLRIADGEEGIYLDPQRRVKRDRSPDLAETCYFPRKMKLG